MIASYPLFHPSSTWTDRPRFFSISASKPDTKCRKPTKSHSTAQSPWTTATSILSSTLSIFLIGVEKSSELLSWKKKAQVKDDMSKVRRFLTDCLIFREMAMIYGSDVPGKLYVYKGKGKYSEPNLIYNHSRLESLRILDTIASFRCSSMCDRGHKRISVDKIEVRDAQRVNILGYLNDAYDLSGVCINFMRICGDSDYRVWRYFRC